MNHTAITDLCRQKNTFQPPSEPCATPTAINKPGAIEGNYMQTNTETTTTYEPRTLTEALEPLVDAINVLYGTQEKKTCRNLQDPYYPPEHPHVGRISLLKTNGEQPKIPPLLNLLMSSNKNGWPLSFRVESEPDRFFCLGSPKPHDHFLVIEADSTVPVNAITAYIKGVAAVITQAAERLKCEKSEP